MRNIFIDASQEIGIFPDHVRCDKGKENVSVMFMMHLYNDGKILKPVLTGHFVHNT